MSFLDVVGLFLFVGADPGVLTFLLFSWDPAAAVVAAATSALIASWLSVRPPLPPQPSQPLSRLRKQPRQCSPAAVEQKASS